VRASLQTCLALALVGACLVGEGRPEQDPAAPSLGQRFLAKHCVDCHSGWEPDGNLRLDDVAAVSSKTWSEVYRRASSGSMPPDDEDEGPRPTAAEIAAFGSWLRAEGHLPRLASVAALGSRPALRRLTRSEYEHAVRDLLGIHSRPTRDWPRDEVADGFDTSSAAASLTPSYFQRALEAAERVAAEAILVLEPLKTRIPAKELDAKGRVYDVGGGYRKLVTSGSFGGQITVPHRGRYRIRIRVYGDQAGPDPVRVSLRVDGRRHGIKSTRSTKDKPETLQFVIPLEVGKRRFEVYFLNDYYRPQAKDPKQRDRNFSLKWVEFEGPVDRPPLPPGHKRLLGDAKRLTWEGLPEILGRLATRAYRRPAKAGEVARLTKLAASARARREPPEVGLRLGLTAILASPHFLLRSDLDPGPSAGTVPRRLEQRALASRLSFFLWGSLPDRELAQAAQEGTLERDYLTQVKRLLDDPRSSSLVEDFGRQWLQLSRLEEATPDALAFPDFDEALRSAMATETELVLEAILREDRPAHEVIDGRFTFVNGRLAKHYGWSGVEGARFRRVSLPPGRSGVLTHASVLTLTSEPERASLVKRGKWLLEVILADPPPPPPPGVDSLGPEAKARPDLPFAKRLELHRRRADCRSCHSRMDPLGVSLERYSGTGALRRDADLVNSKGKLPDGRVLDGVPGLRKALGERRGAFLRGLSRALLTYGLGRPLALEEREEVRILVKRLGEGVGLRRLVLELVQTRAFRQGWQRKEAR
jgi:PAS domain-containing protein